MNRLGKKQNRQKRESNAEAGLKKLSQPGRELWRNSSSISVPHWAKMSRSLSATSFSHHMQAAPRRASSWRKAVLCSWGSPRSSWQLDKSILDLTSPSDPPSRMGIWWYLSVYHKGHPDNAVGSYQGWRGGGWEQGLVVCLTPHKISYHSLFAGII